MKATTHLPALWLYVVIVGTPLNATAQPAPARRVFKPEDLFRVRQVGATCWSSDGRYAAIEFTRPGRELGESVPTSEIALLDVNTRKLRTLSSNATNYLGFFEARWSPNGQRLALLSVNQDAVVQVWTWRRGAKSPTVTPDIDVRVGPFEPSFAWIDSDRLALLGWAAGAEKSGELYLRILHGPNAANQWRRGLDPHVARVSALESRGATVPPKPIARLVALDLRSNRLTTLALGDFHRLSVSEDGRFIAFVTHDPQIPDQRVASYFAVATGDESMYDNVNWGTARRVIDAQSGVEVTPSLMPVESAKSTPKPLQGESLPRSDARRVSRAPADDSALYVANASDGSHLWICGGGGRPMASCTEIWRANEWMRDIKPGQIESIAYNSTDGMGLTAWLLLPPDYVPGKHVPVITVVYPGTTYSAATPSSFSFYQANFEHPQLFAALGYAVLLPSMPRPKTPADLHAITLLPSGVMPAVDAVIARGFADPDRIAVMGQSGGGFATVGLITQTTRFRSAIASASYSNLASLCGTFYGQYRYGDTGHPQSAQVLRMLKIEKRFFALGGRPSLRLIAFVRVVLFSAPTKSKHH